MEAAADPCPGRALLEAARHVSVPALAALAAECEVRERLRAQTGTECEEVGRGEGEAEGTDRHRV